MKKLLTLLLLLPAIAFAQQAKDVLRLKNGSVIRGTVLELAPTGNVKIETADGNVLVYPMREVDRLSKDEEGELAPTRESGTVPQHIGKTGSRVQAKSGYIGIGFGISSPVGSYRHLSLSNSGARAGVQANLLNFGYLFTENVGIQSSILFGNNRYRSSYNGHRRWWYGGMMAGPLFSVPMTQTLSFDFRPSVGLMNVSAPGILNHSDGFMASYYDHIVCLPASAGVSFRMRAGKSLVLSLNADMMAIIPTDVDLPSMSLFTATVGAAFRLGK